MTDIEARIVSDDDPAREIAILAGDGTAHIFISYDAESEIDHWSFGIVIDIVGMMTLRDALVEAVHNWKIGQ